MTIRTLLEYKVKVKKYSSNETLGVIDFDVSFFKTEKDIWYQITKPNFRHQSTLGKYHLMTMNSYGAITLEIIK